MIMLLLPLSLAVSSASASRLRHQALQPAFVPPPLSFSSRSASFPHPLRRPCTSLFGLLDGLQPTDNVSQLSDEVLSGAQLSPESVKKLLANGVKSVLNVRAAIEPGYRDDSELCEGENCGYFHSAVTPFDWSRAKVDGILATVEAAPKPIFIHCAANIRSAAVAVLHEVKSGRLSEGDAVSKAKMINDRAGGLVERYLKG
ncbi:unnamed protein product [Vitrella brassicaformis CCMP3155]|uniref:Tyrosine specific protein phosphatases domain-containing protein n=1 Tax=Vitrella brassicaformis (strain CCMP3155) TaxID=1169540 RepID=A0A0G4FVH2_VITBC|nr:unnamed protein product [Vitrella brassicaformis CCMP3155]|eukprot:CEM19085.1 unnamed protein product [Vitrella brassicaformis CCMP3155]